MAKQKSIKSSEGGKPKSSASKVSKTGPKPASALRSTSNVGKPTRETKSSNDKDTKRSKVKASTTSIKNVVAVEEVDFPRGGGTSLTAAEVARARQEGHAEAEGHLFNENADETEQRDKSMKKKRKLADRKEKRSGIPSAGKGKAKATSDGHIKDALRVEHLNYKRLLEGTKVAGVIVNIKPLEMIVSLPNQLLGHIPITHISNYYFSALEAEQDEDAEDDDDGDEETSDALKPSKAVKQLDELFTVGQWVRCIVNGSSDDKSAASSSRSHNSRRNAHRVTLSLDPCLLNASIPRRELCKGFSLTASVKSREDRGWILDTGVMVDAESSKKGTVEAFVTFEAVQKTYQGEWQVGQIVDCCIAKVAENGKTCTVTLAASDISSSALTEAASVGTPLPLHLVTCLVTAVIPGAGLNVKFLGLYDGTIDLYHLPFNALKADQRIEDSYTIGQKVKARILWDTASSPDEPPRYALSMLPHVVKLDTTEKAFEAGEESSKYPLGTSFESVRVDRVDSEWGLCVTCIVDQDGVPLVTPVSAFVHISAVSDEHSMSLSPTTGRWKIGTTHRARCVGLSTFDGLLQLSLQPSILSKRFLHVRDLVIGEAFEGKVNRFADNNSALFVDIGGAVDGVVWPLHFADVKLKHPERRFKALQNVKAKIFSVDKERNRVVLTLKRSLIQSKLPVFSNVDDVKEGDVVNGVVSKILEKGMLVDCFGGVRVWIPISEVAESFTTKISERFSVAQVVKIQIIRVDKDDEKIVGSVRQAEDSSISPTNGSVSVKAGDVIIGIVVAVHTANVVLSLQPSKVKALMSLTILAKNRNQSVDSLRMEVKEGLKIDNLTVTRMDDERNLAIVGITRQGMQVNGDQDNLNTTLSFDSLLEGRKVFGKVIQRLPAGVVVQISRNLRGRVAWTDLCDNYDDITEVLAQRDTKIQCVVTGLNAELGRLDLASRQSLVTQDFDGVVKDRLVKSIDDLEEGTKIRGIVKNVSDTGLFVSLGKDVTARVQIRNLFDEFVKDWKPRFEVGKVVEGVIAKVDHDTSRIEMTLRTIVKGQPKETKAIIQDFILNQVVDVVVKSVTAFGAFFRIVDTSISGLCHKSQIVDDAERENWKEKIKEGDVCKAVVIEVNPETRRIAFSIAPTVLMANGVEVEEEHVDPNADVASEDLDVDVGDSTEIIEGLSINHGIMNESDEGEIENEVENVDDDESNDPNSIAASNQSMEFEKDQGDTLIDVQPDDNEQHEDVADVVAPVKKKRRIEAARPAPIGPADLPESVDDFERLLLGSPSSSYLWIQLMSFHLQSSNVKAARLVAQRALNKGISFREEGEHFNVWMAWLNLENTFGSEEELEKVFSEACRACEAKHVWLKLGEIYEQTNKIEDAREHYERIVKKFSQSSKVWTAAGSFAISQNRADDARELLRRSMQSLEKRKHVKTVSKFAQLEFKQGDAERGRTLYEGLVSSFPKRTDIWNVYIDMEVTKGRQLPNRPRSLFQRMLDLGLNTKRSKFVFKKWLAFEQTHGDVQGQEVVKQKAREYVESKATVVDDVDDANDDA